ncbi:IclR family transcriptional regulator [Bacillus benzoevorans]|uniref:Glycerol operon regulatory protein n=1 Tax=Bacillus benzoevorans TaxID=1456 RepID=A0A7X0HP05_9BACI|nr:IclR family transcriptional regulator [Bacillus benzoevorans]MBB6444274.1 DNA-binding IclR family transcriptional regulator [Bacillus benzoevorans]
MEKEQDHLLSSVKNTLKILRSFKMDQPQKGVRELAAELGMGKSSVHRILATLASEGFVRKNEESNKYELGASLLELSSIVLNNIDLHNEAYPFIKKLAEKCNETAHLAVLENLEVMYLCKVEAEQSEKISSYSGLHNHPHCTSSGKLLLAYSDTTVMEAILERGLRKFTPNTITDPVQFRKELAGIYERKYAVSHDELTVGISSVSAPIKDYTGKVIAAINFVGPSQRFTSQRVQYLANELLLTGKIISERLGY